jgi:hypothetical protein
VRLVERLWRLPLPVRPVTSLPLRAGGVIAVLCTYSRQDVLARIAAAAIGPEAFVDELEDRAATVLIRNNRDPRWFRAAVFREPWGEDEWRVAVHAIGFGPIGYFDRQAAIDYTPVFDELERLDVLTGTCPGRLTGSDAVGPRGAVLALSAPMAVLAGLREGGS